MADITYIHTVKDGWCYLASVLDLHSKKIVGYSFSRSMTTELVLQALNNAMTTQKPNSGLILHTDLGTQYTSEAFTNTVHERGMIQSFSRKGCPYDNACIESFHAILKKEEVHQVNIWILKLTNGHCFNRLRVGITESEFIANLATKHLKKWKIKSDIQLES